MKPFCSVPAIAATVLLGACAAASAMQIPIRRLSPDQSPPFLQTSGLRDPATLAVRDPEGWRQLWGQIQSVRRPTPPVPAVDFEREMVIVVALGRKTSGGFGVAITSVELDGDSLVVHVEQHAPGAGCVVTTGLTAPVDIGVVARSAAALRFDVMDVVDEC